MNYDDKIKNLTEIITKDYFQLMRDLNQLTNRSDNKKSSQGMTIPINAEEANNIRKQVDTLKININRFNYYTSFYPNKETIWSESIGLIDSISNILDKLAIDRNIRDGGVNDQI